MQDDGFGTVNEDLQMGVLPLKPDGKVRDGIAVTLRGSAVTRTQIEIQAVDFYVRNTNPLTASQKAQQILEYLQDSFSELCTLPPLDGVTEESYSNVTIIPTSSVEFVGVDENNGHSFVVSGEVRYIKN
mgnify:CR=1 FL=1